jgi:hypothetical protein
MEGGRAACGLRPFFLPLGLAWLFFFVKRSGVSIYACDDVKVKTNDGVMCSMVEVAAHTALSVLCLPLLCFACLRFRGGSKQTKIDRGLDQSIDRSVAEGRNQSLNPIVDSNWWQKAGARTTSGGGRREQQYRCSRGGVG